MQPIAPHHQLAIDRTIERFSADPHVRAVVLAGSISRGMQKENSDVDVIILLDDEGYEQRRRSNVLSDCVFDLCDYKGGYVDMKFLPRDFLVAAAERGSEPTRHSFLGARTVFTRDGEIDSLLQRIAVYPEHERDDKIRSFYAGLQLCSGFFWGEARKRNEAYLRVRTMADIVLFGCRLVLAHNRVLFPCQKWMLDALDKASEKPENFRGLAETFLALSTEESMKAFAGAVKGFRDWGVGKDWRPILSRYVEDHEQWWWRHRPNIAEW